MKLNPTLMPLMQRTIQTEETSKLNNDDVRLRKAAEDFEALLTQQMLKTMREAGFKSDLLPESNGEKIFRSSIFSDFDICSIHCSDNQRAVQGKFHVRSSRCFCACCTDVL